MCARHRQFNVLWLNPANPDTFPDGFIDALEDPEVLLALKRQQHDGSIEGRVRARMQADALQPINSLDDDETADIAKTELAKTPYSEEDIKEAAQFLRLTVRICSKCIPSYLWLTPIFCLGK